MTFYLSIQQFTGDLLMSIWRLMTKKLGNMKIKKEKNNKLKEEHMYFHIPLS